MGTVMGKRLLAFEGCDREMPLMTYWSRGHSVLLGAGRPAETCKCRSADK